MGINLTVITVNFNGLKDTCELIDSITFSDDMEVIVVDNGSRDDEASVIAQRYPTVRTIRSEKNLGFAGGNNLGIKAARGKYIFLLNNDTVIGSGLITSHPSPLTPHPSPLTSHPSPLTSRFQPLIDRLESSPKIGVVCPKIRFSWDDRPIQFAGYTPLSPVTLRNRSIGYGETDNGQYDRPHPTPYAHGAAMLVRREAVERAGLMPECYFLYYEELDWSLMIRRAGYEIWYDPAFTVYHKESQTTGQDSPLRTYFIARNRLLFTHRNIPAPRKLLTYIYLICVVGVRDVVKHLLCRRVSNAKATIKGIADFHRRRMASSMFNLQSSMFNVQSSMLL